MSYAPDRVLGKEKKGLVLRSKSEVLTRGCGDET